jgi:beta-glucanase (GH16 family)
MRNLFYLAAFTFSGVCFAQTPANDPHWQLVFSDEFNDTVVDPTKWDVQNNFDYLGHAAGEQVPVFIDDNVTESGGYLTCATKLQSYYCPSPAVNEWGCSWQYQTGYPYPFTAGAIESKPAHNFKYGYIEARMKVEAGSNLWSAFWTFRGDGVPGGPNTANEIDIYEILSDPTIVKTNIHWDYCQAGAGGPQYGCGEIPVGEICPGVPCMNMDLSIDNTNTFHVYGLEWSPNKIFWYIDGVCVRVENNTYGHVLSELRLGICTNKHAPIIPFPPATNHLPGEQITDYVRVYELATDCNTVINTGAFWFGGYSETVKKSITIGGPGYANTQPANTTHIMRATDFILLNGEFTVPLGSTMYADVAPCY